MSGIAKQQASKLCPLLSVATLRTAAVTDGTGAFGARDAVPCQGDHCALWVNIGENGRITDGACTLTLIPTALSNIAAAVLAMQRKPDQNGPISH